jgi:hypothetical protein
LPADHLRSKLLLLLDHYPQGLLFLLLLLLVPELDKKARVASAATALEKPLSQRFFAWFNAEKSGSSTQFS